MIAAMSGFFVPPTSLIAGCSQNRVQATTSTPSASNVSVDDGTRLTTRIDAESGTSCAEATRARLAAVRSAQEAALLPFELLGRQRAAVEHALQLLQLAGDVERGLRRVARAAGMRAR